MLKKILIAVSILIMGGVILFFMLCIKIEYEYRAQYLTEEEKDIRMDETVKEYCGENGVRVKDCDDGKNIYKISGVSGDLEPIYFWFQIPVIRSESNFQSQQTKRDAVDFWDTKDRNVYYVNRITGEEELLSNDINSMERLFEEDWKLKVEFKSESDIPVLASELADWTEYAFRKSPYVSENGGLGISHMNTIRLLSTLEVEGETDSDNECITINLADIYISLENKGKTGRFQEEIENFLLSWCSTLPKEEKIIKGSKFVEGREVPVDVLIRLHRILKGEDAYNKLYEQNKRIKEPDENEEYIIAIFDILYDDGEFEELSMEKNKDAMENSGLYFYLSNSRSEAEDMTAYLEDNIYNISLTQGQIAQGSVAFLQEKGNEEPLYFIGFGKKESFLY